MPHTPGKLRTHVRASRRMGRPGCGRPPIPVLPEIGALECASRLQPTCDASRRIAALLGFAPKLDLGAAMLLSMRAERVTFAPHRIRTSRSCPHGKTPPLGLTGAFCVCNLQ